MNHSLVSNMVADRELRDLIFYLKLQGLWYKFDGKYSKILAVLQHIRLVYFGMVYPFIVASMYYTGLKDSLSKYAFLASAGVYVIIKAVAYFFNQKKTEVIVNRLIKLHKTRSIPWEHEIFYKYSEAIWKLLYSFSYLAVFFIVTYFIFPLIYDSFLLAYTESKTPFNFPFPLEGLTNKDRSFQYYIMLVASLFWCINLLSYALGSLAVLWVVVSYCCVDLRIICSLVDEFASDVNDVQKMGELINDYKQIVELSQDMKQVIGLPMAAQNAVGSLLLTLFLYSATVQDDVVFIVMSVYSLSCMTVVMFFSCFIGETLQIENSKLFDAFCELPWYEMTPAMRRTLSFIIMVASRPMVIDYKGKLPLNLQTFMQMINSSYSYLMLLYSMN